jgi:8-oxo-dGTP pyrophosphatase MutT (NUDIX family)
MSSPIFTNAFGEKLELTPGKEITWRLSAYPLVEQEGKILSVIPTWSPKYELPGGGVEIAESILEGCIRECYEETGYKIEITERLPVWISEQFFHNKPKDTFHHSIIMVYKARLISVVQDTQVINTLDGDEISKINWLEPADFTKENTHPVIFPALAKLLQLPK